MTSKAQLRAGHRAARTVAKRSGAKNARTYAASKPTAGSDRALRSHQGRAVQHVLGAAHFRGRMIDFIRENDAASRSAMQRLNQWRRDAEALRQKYGCPLSMEELGPKSFS